jgi:hypothetical protein
MNRWILAFLLLTLGWVSLNAQATTTFRGRPSLKVSEGGTERTPETLTADRAINLECVISKLGDEYYWASRENVRMVRVESGAFITYVAINGSGYVRQIVPAMKAVASLSGGTESKFDYVEHLLIGLKSVTYYGVAR